MDKLRECPFCGGDASVAVGRMAKTNEPFEYIECDDCASTSESAKRWNTRTTERVRVLEEALGLKTPGRG